MLLSGMGDIEPPGFVVDLIKANVDSPKIHDWLEAQGRKVVASFVKLPGGSSDGAPSAPNPWVDKVAGPILGPFAAGAKDEATMRVVPVVLLGLVVAGGLGYLFGRARRGGRRA